MCVGCSEVFGEVGQDGGEAVVFVESRESTGGELMGRISIDGEMRAKEDEKIYLEAFIEPFGEAGKNHTHLFPHWDICFPSFEEDPPLFDKFRHGLEIDLEPAPFLDLLFLEAWRCMSQARR